MGFPTFTEFYFAIYGRKPFRWQEQLAKKLCNGTWDWEAPLSMPTSAGKTVILVAWYYALAYNLYRGDERYIPLRLFYVVNRRILINSVEKEARKIQKALSKKGSPVLETVAGIIRSKLNINKALTVGKMSGGLDAGASNHWCVGGAYTPNMPSIVTSSVDHLGSRLLFRSYGSGMRGRSIDAAMVGIDSLIVVDESHIARPLIQTLRVIKNEIEGFVYNVPSSQILEMSATTGSKWSFSIDNDPLIRQRMGTKKPVKLVECGEESFDKVMKQEMLSLLEDGSRRFICVIFNTVDGARRFHTSIQNSKDYDSLLLTGRMRAYEKDKILSKYILPKDDKDKRHLLSGRDRNRDKPLILVATQTIEVGVDLDADGMITECAPLDCLIQRFGRLGRLGDFENCMGVIVRNIIKKKGVIVLDPVYGELPDNTFDYLQGFSEGGVIPSFRDVTVPEYEVGYSGPDLFCKYPATPDITREVLGQLAYTNSSIDINLDPYLHGTTANKSSSFTLIYRSEIDDTTLSHAYEDEEAREGLETLLDMARPSPKERLELPLSVIYADGTVSDNEMPPASVPINKKGEIGRQFCVRKSDYKVVRMIDIKKGDEVFVPLSFGRYDDYGWNAKAKGDASDVFDDCQSKVIRLHPLLVPGFDIDRCVKERTDLSQVITKSLLYNHVKGIDTRVYKKLLKLCKGSYRHTLTPDGKGLYVYATRKEARSKAQSLEQHQKAGANLVRKICKSLGFDEDLTTTMVAAFRYHDIGKAEPRYQTTFWHPDPFDGINFLAKPRRSRPPRMSPRGWRHEMQSVSMVIENKLDRVPHPSLMRHLIRTHHGYGRPSIRPIADEKFQPFEFGKHKSTIPYIDVPSQDEEFRELQETYGFWGLAFLESIIRLADYTVSHE